MTPRESKICNAAREAVRTEPKSLRDVVRFVNEYFPQERLGNPVTEATVAGTVGRLARSTLRQFVRDGECWLRSVERQQPGIGQHSTPS